MSWIDVSDITMDPTIAGTKFLIERREEVVDTHGRSGKTEETIPAIGSITPCSPNSLVRIEAYQNGQRAIKVITKNRLYGPVKDYSGNTYQPDIIIWKGNRFVVKTVNDFSEFGAGMIEAECVSTENLEQAPA